MNNKKALLAFVGRAFLFNADYIQKILPASVYIGRSIAEYFFPQTVIDI